MTDRPGRGTTDPAELLPSSDADVEAAPVAIPGAGGPMGGSITGELVDALGQPIDIPGERPVLATD